MSIEKLLAKLSDWKVVGDGPHQSAITLPTMGWTVTLTADRVDTVGTLFTQLSGVREFPVADDAVAEEAHARKVAGRVSGLQEALAFVEMDRVQHIALLRSAKPTLRGEQLFYYEVKFQGRNHVTVERLQANRTGKAERKPVPFALTHEVASQFIHDLIAE
jgi:hypothetical protein